MNIVYKDNSIGEFIKTRRVELKMKQKDLANIIDLKTSTVSLYEAGKRTPDIETLRKIAKAIDTSLATLLKIDVPPNNLDVALRARDLTGEDIKEVKKYISYIKHRKTQ